MLLIKMKYFWDNSQSCRKYTIKTIKYLLGMKIKVSKYKIEDGECQHAAPY